MPFFPEEDTAPDYAEVAAAKEAVTPDQIKAAANYTNITTRSPFSSLGGVVGLAGASVLDLGDTVASSLIPGVDRQAVNNTFLGAIGSPGLTKWFDENRGAIEVGSGIAGVIAADIATRGILKEGGAAMSVARKLPVVRSIAALDSQYNNALRLAKLTQAEVAARGLTGADRFLGEGLKLARLGAPALETSRAAASSGFIRSKIALGLRQNIAMEGVMAATLHTNSFLYSDDISHNVAWGLAGLGIGAGIDNLIGTYTLRKMANSGMIRRLNAGAYDVNGLEKGRIGAGSLAEQIRGAADGSAADTSWLFGGHGATTDAITSLAIDAKELSQQPVSLTDRARSLFRKREAIATPKLSTAQEELQKVTTSGLRGVKRAGFSTKMEGLGAPLHEAMFRDPAFFYGIEELGTTVENMTRQETALLRDKNLKARFDQVQDLIKNGGRWETRRVKGPDGLETGQWEQKLVPLKEGELEALHKEAKELHFAASHTPVTMLEPGEWMPIQMGEVADGFQPFQPVKEGGLGQDDIAMWSRPKADPKEPTMGLRSDGELFLPGNGKLESLKLHDMIGLFHIGNKAVRDMAAAGTVLTLPANPSWFHLDLAEQLIKATDDVNMVQFPGSMTRESAQVESFAQKVAAVQRESATMKLTRRGSAEPNLTDVDMYKLRVKYNLPRLNSMQLGQMGTAEHPIDVLLSSFKTADQVRKLSHVELLKGLNDARSITGFTDQAGESLSDLHGNSFNFMLDRDGNAIKPIIGYMRPLAPMDWSRDALLVRQITNQAHLRDVLMGETADPVTRMIVQGIESDPHAAEARKVMELADDQHRSFVPGARNAAPQTGTGSLINAITSRERRDVDNSVMLAASRVRELTTRIVQDTMRKIITGAMGDTITLVNSQRNLASKTLLDQFHTFRPGWELAREPVNVTMPDGSKGFAFVLDHESITNQKRFAQMFDGRKLEKGQKLLNPSGQEVVLDGLGFDVLNRMQTIHSAAIDMKNTLLRSQGLTELKAVPWYVPAPSTKGKYVGFTFDAQNNVVPGMSIIADSPEQLAKMEAELAKSPQWQNGYTFRQRSEVGSFMNLWDKAQMDWMEPTTTAIQPKKHNFGKTGGTLHNANAFSEALITMRDSMVKHGDDLLEVLFDDPIKAAQQRAKIARVESEVGSRSAEQHSSIYDRYVQNLLGRNALSAKDSFFGDAMAWTERRLNSLLKDGSAKLTSSQVYQSLKDHLILARPGDKASEARFKRLTEELGPYMPFKSVTQMLERETGSATPPEVAAITAKLSWFEATSRLRWFESMHAVANMGGILSNMPAVIRALQPMAGETLEEAAARNANLTMLMATPGGKGMILPNIPKLMWASMKDAWKKAPDAFTEKAIARGFMHQEVAEFNRQWGSIDSKAGWRKFVFGDESAEAGKNAGPFAKAANKVVKTGGLDKWLGILSDRSEDFSRAWGMYAGKRVAESLGIHDVDAQLSFAHDLTNKMIANYDPRNRPEIFQGALGATIGLFQSYAINYYQRMFRYLETENHRALATQMAAQSAVFGINSLPGWNALNWAFFDHQTHGDEDPVDSIYKRFDRTTADLLMHGTLSNLPKLAGADGINLYTRGDSEVRMPVLNYPIADTMHRVYKGVGQALDMVGEGNVSPKELAEIASNVVTNRPLGGMLELAAGGADTDWNGNVTSRVKSLSDGVYRAMGVRSMQSQKELEAYYQNKSIMADQAARKQELNRMSRAAIRRGDYDALPGLFTDYVEAGGRPEYWSRWVKQNFSAAGETRGEKQLQQALKNPDSQKVQYMQRLLDAGVDTPDAENGDDYGAQAEMESVIEQGWQDRGEPTETPLDHQSITWEEPTQ